MAARIRRFVCNASFLLPFVLVFHLLRNPSDLYFPVLRLDVYDLELNIGFLLFNLMWLFLLPYGNGCRDGSWSELCFHLVPAELLLALFFAQHHFYLTLALLLLIQLLSFLFRCSLRRDEKKTDPDPREHRINLIAGRRFFVLVTAVVLLVPGVLTLFVYRLETPRFEPQQDLLPSLLSTVAPCPGEEASAADPPDVSAFLGCFAEERWAALSLEERITVLQLLEDYEAHRMGIPAVPVSAARISPTSLAVFYPGKNAIDIQLDGLTEVTAEDAVNSLLHEFYHSYQQFVVNGVDWDSDFAGCAFFAEARTWKENAEDYRNDPEDFDGYWEQPLEVSARDFAREEGWRLLTLPEFPEA